MKYIDPICDAKFKKCKITYWQDSFGHKWSIFYYKDIETDYYISNYGQFYNNKYNRMVTRREDMTGHSICNMYLHGELYSIRMNRAVMQTFHPIEEPEKYVVNHLDGDPFNDYEENLEWTTHLGNKLHALENDLIYSETEATKARKEKIENKAINEIAVYNLLNAGVSVEEIHKLTGCAKNMITRILNDNSSSKYTESDIRLVGELLSSGLTQKKVAEISGVSFREIRRLIDGESWPYIFSEYKDKIKSNQPLSKDLKKKARELIEEGIACKEMIKILGLENNRRSRYLYEAVKKDLKKEE